MFYLVAIQGNPSLAWQWKSTILSSLNTLLQWLQFYQAFPKDRLRIFSSASREEMNEQLARENQWLLSTSVTAGGGFFSSLMQHIAYVVIPYLGVRSALPPREAGWRLRQLPTGHDAMITMPRELAEVLLEVV
jgi:hypothetical protein